MLLRTKFNQEISQCQHGVDQHEAELHLVPACALLIVPFQTAENLFNACRQEIITAQQTNNMLR